MWLPEARWPNVNLTANGPANAPGGPLSLSSWAKTDKSTSLRQGIIVDPALAETDVDWTGALATLNVGVRYYTWTRRVLNHTKGSGQFSYNQSLPQGNGLVGKSKLDQGEDNLYFLSGKLAALDSPGEHFIDETTWTMYVWAPDSRPPKDVSVKVKDWCVQGSASLRSVQPPSPSPDFVPGLPHVICVSSEDRLLFRTRITACYMRIEWRQALVSYQDYRMSYAYRVETGSYFVPGLPHAGAHFCRNVSLFGCTWHLKGNRLAIVNVSLAFPTYHKTIDPRGTEQGPFPAVTTLEGNDSVVSRFHLRYAQNGGLKIVGSRNRVED